MIAIPRMKYVSRIFLVLAFLGAAATTVWSVLALHLDILPGGLGLVLGIPVGTSVLVGFFFLRRWTAFACAGAFFATAFLFWNSIEPSNTREWREEVALPPRAAVKNESVVVKNVRNFNWRGTDDFDVRYEDRRYDLAKLKSVDYIISYWGPRSIAHTIVSFGFAGDEYLAVSVEARKEKTEDYSALKGFFRQYELCFVVADERDVIRLRTNLRDEDVYLYRTNLPPATAKKLLESYLERADHLAERPEFYNAVTNNCTSNVMLEPAAAEDATPPLDLRLYFTGYSDEYVYEQGSFATDLPFEEMKEKSCISERAKAADHSPDFSRKIRDGLPTIHETR